MILDHKGNPTTTLGAQDPQAMGDFRKQRLEDYRRIQGSRYYYDAANKAREDAPNHWKYADSLSADAANSSSVRKILRNHTRFEVANNPYGMGIVDTDTNYVIGKGPHIQLYIAPDVLESLSDGQADAKRLQARQAERLFNRWARHRRINLPDILRTAWRSRIQDGEPFIQLSQSDEKVYGIHLLPELIECDRVTYPKWGTTKTPNTVDGIKLKNGRPVEYKVMKNHPGGDVVELADSEVYNVSAKNMIHWFKCTRAEQHRGIPAVASSVPLFADLRRLTAATIRAAETAADLALVLKTTLVPGGEAAPVQPLDTYPLDKGVLMTLPEGWEPFQVQGHQPSQEYPKFKREIVTEMARPLSMPFNIAACDSSEYNYASGRLDHQTYFGRNRIEQDSCLIEVLNPLVELWLMEASDYYGFNLTSDEVEIEATWRGQRHVDPIKEAKANDISLKNGTATLDMIYAEMGLDFETEIERAAQTVGITVSGYKRLLMTNLFDEVRNNTNNNQQNTQAIAESINDIFAECNDSDISDESRERLRLQALCGDIGVEELRDKLQTITINNRGEL